MSLNEIQDHDGADVLIIGAGIAGLSTAIKLATHFPQWRILLVSKDKPGESNTRYAQGGIAAVVDKVEDSFERHISDTLRAGDGLCHREVVEFVVHEAPERLKEVIAWGANFDYDHNGNLQLGLEGGHSASRVVHAKDQTGSAVVQTLLRKLESLGNIRACWQTLAVDLLIEKSNDGPVCRGISYMNAQSNGVCEMNASFVILATGGAGHVYPVTTNPPIATGDGIAMAYRAGARIADMAFVQFHPTALKTELNGVAFLISEALRGFGAHLVTDTNERFMYAYDVRGELAPRDIVARAIYEKSRQQQVYLDCQHLSPQALKQNFPKIYETCKLNGIDITRDKIPVMPAAHYLCGGIVVNLDARTTIENLYAIGECACTGLHGANRLASNSLIEALVFAHRCYIDISKRTPCQRSVMSKQKAKNARLENEANEHHLRELQGTFKMCMEQSAGIVRSNRLLQNGYQKVERLCSIVDQMTMDCAPNWLLYETKNLLTVGRIILQQALEQKQNKGTHFNRDLIEKNEKEGFPIL